MNQSITISTHTIFHPYIEVSVINNLEDIPRSICNTKQAHHTVKRQPIYINDTDNYYILYEIEYRDHI